jgi:N-acetyl-alpha-D-muramate 1-phosphate uridylyltransferase
VRADPRDEALYMTLVAKHQPITTAMVLAAGLGTRMRPLTDTMSKPMVPLAGRPMIDHVLDRIAAAAIARAIVNVHHFADGLEAHVRKRLQPQILVSDERAEVLETGGGVVKALPLLGPGPFLIHNSDAVWIENPRAGRDGTEIQRLLTAWDDARMDGLLLVTPTSAMLGYDGAGDFLLLADGRLARRAQGETAPFVFTGVSIAHPRLFDGAPAGRHSLNVPWDAAIARGRLRGVIAGGQFMHVGTPAAIAEAERCIAANAGR